MENDNTPMLPAANISVAPGRDRRVDSAGSVEYSHSVVLCFTLIDSLAKQVT